MFNKLIAAVLPYMPKKLIWIFSRTYIAGETVEDAVRVSRELNAEGIMVTIDVLGEFIENLDADHAIFCKQCLRHVGLGRIGGEKIEKDVRVEEDLSHARGTPGDRT